jgi:aerobic carbon-monoxide dehydrogenase medium subunit
MYAFKYERPTALADAQKAAQAGGQVLAGGQTMIAAMKQRLQQPETLIDLAAISGLAGIKKDGNNIVIGAMTRHQDVADNADVQKNIPGLALLANNIGDKQVRAMGTIGGLSGQQRPCCLLPQRLVGFGRHHPDRQAHHQG